MLTFHIQSETLQRLSTVIRFFEPTTDEETRTLLNAVRLEHRAGHSYAIVTNQKIAAVEHLGATDQPDSVAHLNPSVLLGLQGLLTITVMPEIALATCQDEQGNIVGDCCHWFDSTPLDGWRDWAAPVATESKGAMYWDLYHIETLLAASPSGKVVFPKFIDVEKPIVLRDRHVEGWVGLFIPSPPIGEPAVKPAELPTWFQ